MMISRMGAASLLGVWFASLAAGALAQEASFPTRRSGFWEQSMTMNRAGAPRTMTMQACIDASTEREYSAFSRVAGHNCSSRHITPIPGGFKFASTCSANGQTHTSTGTVTGDFNSHVHMDVSVSGADGQRRMVMDMKYLGPCPASRAPGDVVMPGGMVMNMAAMPH